MRLIISLLVFTCITSQVFDPTLIAAEPAIDVKDVRQVRGAIFIGCPDDGVSAKRYQDLIRMGEKLFPAYEAILSDPKSSDVEIGGVFCILCQVKADPHRFLKYALARLTDAKGSVRLSAVNLLGRIGSPAEASPLVALLSDRDRDVVYAAARTVADIGGPTEVVAMDVFLRGVTPVDKPSIYQYVRECRDKLNKRLDDAKDPKKRAQTIEKCWRDLLITDEDVRFKVDRASWQLTRFGAESVIFLKNSLQPVPVSTQRRLDLLLLDLDSDSFDRREAATRELSLGLVADVVLEKARAHSRSPEYKRRLEAILQDFPEWSEKNPELLRQVRAIWVLQQIGTPEAKALLEKLAAGAPSARLTQKARDALESLKKR